MSDGKKDAEDTPMHADASPEDASQTNDMTGETADDLAESPAEAPAFSDESHEAAHDDHHYDDEHHEEAQGWSTAAKALAALVLLIAGGALALIAGPKIAPMLPAGVAQYFAPNAGADVEEMEARIAALEDALEVSANALQNQITSTSEDNAGKIAALEARIEAGAGPGGEEIATLAARIDDSEATLAGLREELSALSSAPGVEGGSLSDAAVSGLRAELAAISQKADAAMERRVAPLEAEVAALNARLALVETAVSDVSASGRGAAGAAAFATLATAVNSAAPYANELKTFTSVSGLEAPEALSASATTGAPSMTSLRATFPDAARAAISAATMASAGENYSDQALAWLESQVAIRPARETEGDTPAAILSRAEARLDEGALKAALAELESLPTVSRDAMAGWSARAERRAAVDAALSELAASMLPGAAASN